MQPTWQVEAEMTKLPVAPALLPVLASPKRTRRHRQECLCHTNQTDKETCLSPRKKENCTNTGGTAHLTGGQRFAIMGTMPERNLQIARFIGETPSLAYCDVCRLTFRTRQEFLLDPGQAKQQLQSDFEKHECKPESQAVNDALEHIG